MREAESLRIGLPDVDAQGSRVWVRAFEKGCELEGRGRWVDLPAWVMRWVVLRMGEVWQHRPDSISEGASRSRLLSISR